VNVSTKQNILQSSSNTIILQSCLLQLAARQYNKPRGLNLPIKNVCTLTAPQTLFAHQINKQTEMHWKLLNRMPGCFKSRHAKVIKSVGVCGKRFNYNNTLRKWLRGLKNARVLLFDDMLLTASIIFIIELIDRN